MSEALNNALSTIAEFVPKLLLFLVILLIGIVLAKAIGKALSAILERVGFDRAVERGGVKKALENSKYDASDVVSKIIYYALVLFVLQLAFGVFPANPISVLLSQIIAFLPRLIVAIIIIVVASAIAAAVRELISNSLGGLSYGKTLANIASVFILGFGVIAALNQIGVATTVTTPILIAVLATLGGILVVGVGGGLVQPMAKRWEGYLTKAEDEMPRIKEQAANAPSVKQQAQHAKNEAQHRY
ncbi:Conserved TM helix repeat-containing protein [Rhodococcus sp. AW25M09]|uniref:mechanosensitive ion channel family protein n=1 Tax=Rhodococcus sp. AW25M09 TaxID=1268303 RepID=UPI0002ABC57D|nr:Conserved TM helix repeat-containing protein [Rhodococcus sp. AW25M09]CCQ18467.1 Conserved TM helix repeat-containing protein [Rhodococcus sp. AW25M09]